MDIKEVIGAITIVILLGALSFTSMVAIDRENTIEDLKSDVEEWKDMYLNYDCPEVNLTPVIIYRDRWHNTTSWDNQTIWVNETVYVNNSICDVNRDGTVDVLDAAEVLWYVKYGKTWAETIIFEKYGNPYEKLYDVNVDGRVNKADVYHIWEHSD